MNYDKKIGYIYKNLPLCTVMKLSCVVNEKIKHRNRKNPLVRYDCMLNVEDCAKLLAILHAINCKQAGLKRPRLTMSELIRLIISANLKELELKELAY